MHQIGKVERSSELAKGIAFKAGTISKYTTDANLKITQFKKVEEIYPAMKKTLKESRGYVISDFQDQLEKDWISNLRSNYDININKQALKNLVAQ